MATMVNTAHFPITAAPWFLNKLKILNRGILWFFTDNMFRRTTAYAVFVVLSLA